MNRYILFFLLLALNVNVCAEVKNIGNPRVISYENSIYKAGTQSWQIDVGSTGLAYFANNEGVLEFDGVNWRTYPLPSKTVVRSVFATSDGKIYAGGHNEFGCFEVDETGLLVYHSLYTQLPSDKRDCGEVWKIHQVHDQIIFQSFQQIMIYQNDSMTVVEAPEMFHFSFLINNTLFVNDQAEGLYFLDSDSLIRLKGTEALKGKLIWSMLPMDNKILIATADEGIYEYNDGRLSEWVTPAAEKLKEWQVFCAQKIDDNTVVFGTIQNGILICDNNGEIIQHLNIEKGLQNNTVLSIHLDQYLNLWLGLDNGIDYVEINSPLTYFSTCNNLSSGYTAVIHEGIIYFGTNQGVFYHDWDLLKKGGSEQKFSIIPGTQGQVWSLNVIDGTLFCGHNSGVFIITGTTAEFVSDIQGGWVFFQPEGRNDIVICGTYTYLVKFQKKDGKWGKGTKIKGFRESARFIASAGPQSIWISHGYKGVFRAGFNADFDSIVNIDFYNSKNGFPSDKDISVFEVLDHPIFTTGHGLYKYEAALDSFMLDEAMNLRFPRPDMNILQEDNQGNIWFFTIDNAGVFRMNEDGTYTQVDIPFRELNNKFIKWFQHVYSFDGDNVFLGTQEGFSHYTPVYSKNYQQAFSTYIRSMKVRSESDSTLFMGAKVPESFHPVLKYKYNQVQFDYAANEFENPECVHFFVKLDGYSDNWVDLSNRTTIQYSNMPHGDYNFMVKAVNIFGVESNTANIFFTILPPWYLSRWAFVIYALLTGVFIFLVIRIIYYRINLSKQRFEAEQQKQFAERERKLQIESLKAEKEVIKLRNDKLRSEKVQKDMELANTTMQIIQASKSMTRLKIDLKKLSKDLVDHPAANHVNAIIKRINRNIDSDKQWEVFEKHFTGVHEEFLKRLKEDYPDLSPRELKLCAYLRLNISSKEIADLMNISVRGVEISRYRLRKKLNLEHDKNLTDFIIKF